MVHRRGRLLTAAVSAVTVFGMAVAGITSADAEQQQAAMATAEVASGNPIVTNIRGADPDVHVWDGRVWMYTSQDRPPIDTSTNYSGMDGYHVFSSTDMVNWTDHGEILHSRDVSWGSRGYMWAPGAARRGTTNYLFYPHKDRSGIWRIGVATANSPAGPFADSGRHIPNISGIDPMVLQDGSDYYLYWSGWKNEGGQTRHVPYVAKLKSNMAELAESPRVVSYGATNHKEGIFVFKKAGTYYFTYTDWQGETDQGFWATGSSPYGPFGGAGQLKGAVGPSPAGAQDHHSIIRYAGTWYYFYHVGNYTNAAGEPGAGYRRNASVDYLHFRADGGLKKVVHTTTGVRQVASPGGANPPGVPGRVQAEDFTAQTGGVRIETTAGADGRSIGYVPDGSSVTYEVDVAASGRHRVTFRYASAATGARISVKQGQAQVGGTTVRGTGGWTAWQVVTADVDLRAGTKQRLTLTFEGAGDYLLNLDLFDVVQR
ncbi:family 43 glycosylhydrolase [Micromonospora sediminicola]|uniref:family 43 glycosylhydrolase n=1 Tax=Micromonospora sediminicola TaxID=946078 RepID=UPI0034049B25